MTLLRDIQQAALDSKTSLPDLLRSCKVLASRLKHKEFAVWVDHELQGYPDGASVPPYRHVNVSSLGDFVGPVGRQLRNAPIPASKLPDEFRHVADEHLFREPVSAIQGHIAAAKDGVLNGHWPAELVAFVQQRVPMYTEMTLLSAWRVLPAAALIAILDTVRTRILDFVIAIEDVEPTAGDTGPGEQPKVPPATVNHIYNTTVMGGVASVGASGDTQIRTGAIRYSKAVRKESRGELTRLLKELRKEAKEKLEDESECAEALAALLNVEAQLAKPKPVLERINASLQMYAAIVTVASPTLDALRQLLPVALAAIGAQ